MRTLTGNALLAHTALETWASHVKRGLSGLGYSPISILGRLIAEGFVGAAHQDGHIVDDWPEIVITTERAVMNLPTAERAVVFAEYLHWAPVEARARSCHMSLSRYNRLLHQVRRSVGDYLEASAAFFRKMSAV